MLGAAFPQLSIGVFGVALAFGLTVVTMAYALGHMSGCHLNPAVSVGLMFSNRFPAHEFPGYIGVQVVGAIFGARALYLIASRQPAYGRGGASWAQRKPTWGSCSVGSPFVRKAARSRYG